ncbi:MAG: inosine/xanthosine triphosphatase [Candidatus Woesearchaeota archaeon]
MKIAVGSMNPVKIAAVENVVRKIWPDTIVVGIEVDHGTSFQPNSQKEAIEGATKRAFMSLQQANADLGFGLEGNTWDSGHGMFLDGWVVVVDKNGRKGISNCGCLMLPKKIADAVRKGKELGPATDAFLGTHNIKQKEGTVGILTKGMVTRTKAFEHGVTYALAPFLNPQYYEE